MIRLSLCLSTYRRAAFIAETLESVLPQLTDDVELLVVDGASPDNTEEIVRAFVARHSQIRYFREEINSGIDGDYDKAVGYARGEYCWLFPDDDLLAPGALARVLEAIAEQPDLILVDGAVKDVKLQATLASRRMPFSGVRRYSVDERDRMMAEAGQAISFIGSTIIRRELWLSRDRQSYYGSFFVHVGVAFQQPPISRVMAIGEPLILIRYGNWMWSPRGFEIWAFKWPTLIWSFQGYSDAAKASLAKRHPWRDPKHLLSFRAKGGYSYAEYKRLFADRRIGVWRIVMLAIALMPGKLVHLLGTLHMRVSGQIDGMGAYELLRCSPHSNRLSRWVASVGRRGRHLSTMPL